MVKELFDISEQRINYLTNISEKTKSIYFEIPKTGCSTVKRTMQYIEVDGDTSKLEKNLHDKALSPLSGCMDHEKSPQELLNGNDYFKFTFTRNPFTRVLSTYMDKYNTPRKRDN